MGCEFSFSAKSIDSIVSSIISFGKNVKPSVAICVVSRMVCSLKGRTLGSSTVPNRLILTIPCSWAESNEDSSPLFDSLGCEGDIINLNESSSWTDPGIFLFVIPNKVLSGPWANSSLWKEIFLDVFLGELSGLFEIVGLKSLWFSLSSIGLSLSLFDRLNFRQTKEKDSLIELIFLKWLSLLSRESSNNPSCLRFHTLVNIRLNPLLKSLLNIQ